MTNLVFSLSLLAFAFFAGAFWLLNKKKESPCDKIESEELAAEMGFYGKFLLVCLIVIASAFLILRLLAA